MHRRATRQIELQRFKMRERVKAHCILIGACRAGTCEQHKERRIGRPRRCEARLDNSAATPSRSGSLRAASMPPSSGWLGRTTQALRDSTSRSAAFVGSTSLRSQCSRCPRRTNGARARRRSSRWRFCGARRTWADLSSAATGISAASRGSTSLSTRTASVRTPNHWALLTCQDASMAR